MYKDKNKLPRNVERWFRARESDYNLRKRENLQSRAHTTLKSMCISVRGASLWNGLPEQIKKQTNRKKTFRTIEKAI